MASLNLSIDPSQAISAAQTFQRVLQDIRFAVENLDGLMFKSASENINKALQSLQRLQSVLTAAQQSLQTITTSLVTLGSSDIGGKLTRSFESFRDVLREIRTSTTGLGAALRNAGEQASTREKPLRSTPVQTSAEEAVVHEEMQSALVPITTSVEVLTTYTRALTVAREAITSLSTTTGVFAQSVTTLNPLLELLTMLFTILTSRTQIGSTLFGEMSTRVAVFNRGIVESGQFLEFLILLLDRLINRLQTTQQQFTAFTTGPSRHLLGTGETALTSGISGKGDTQQFTAFTMQRSDRMLPPGAETEIQNVGKAFVEAGQRKERFRSNVRELQPEMEEATLKFNQLFHALISLQIVFGSFTLSRVVSELKSISSDLEQVAEKYQNVNQALLAATGGNQEEASRQFAVAQGIAHAYGLELTTTAESYARLSIAARGTSVEGQGAQRIFQALAAVQAVLGKDTEATGRVFTTFEQVLSRGTLQAGQFIRSLSTSFPGAFREMATAMGKNTLELIDDIQKGKIAADTFVLSFTDALQKSFGPAAANNVTLIKGAFALLEDAILNVKKAVLEGGAEEGLLRFAKGLTETLGNPEVLAAARALGDLLGKVLVGAVWVLTTAIEAFSQHWQIFTGLFLGLVGTGLFVSFATTVGFIALGFGQLGVALAPVLLTLGSIFGLVSGAGALWAAFSEDMAKVKQQVKEAGESFEKLKNAQAPVNTNPPEATRALVEALNKVQKEARTFNQDLENQARLLDATAQGMSTLSGAYDAFSQSLTKLKALERSEVFTGLSPHDVASVKNEVLALFLDIETSTQALASLLDIKKKLDASFQGETLAAGGLNAFAHVAQITLPTPASSGLQKQYDSEIFPLIERVKDLRSQLTALGHTDIATEMAHAFDTWNASLQKSTLSMTGLMNALKNLGDVAKLFKDLQFDTVIERITSRVTTLQHAQPVGLTEQRFAQENIADATKLLGVDTLALTGRTLETSMKRTGSEVGIAFGEGFKQSISEAITTSEQKFDTMKKSLVPHGAGTSPDVPGQFSALITAAGQQHGVDPELVRRVISAESSFNPKAVGHDAAGNVVQGGGQGLMQLVPSTQRRFGVTDAFDPSQNIEGGTRYLHELLQQSGGDVGKALERYRGRTQAEDPKYFQKILGGYQGTGTQEAIGPTITPKPPEVAEVVPRTLETVGVLGVLKDWLYGPAWAFLQPLDAAVQKGQEIMQGGLKEIDKTVGSAQKVTGEILYGRTPETAKSQGPSSIALTVEKASTDTIKTTDDYAKKLIETFNRLGKGTQDVSVDYHGLSEALTAFSLAAAQPDAEQQKMIGALTLTHEQAERYVGSLQNVRKVLENSSITQEDVTHKTDAYKLALQTAGTVAVLTWQNIAVKQATANHQIILGMEQEVTKLDDQTAALKVNANERDAYIKQLELQRSLEGKTLSDEDRLRAPGLIDDIKRRTQALKDAQNPLQQSIDSIGVPLKRQQQVVVDALSSLGDAIATFASTGKINIKNWADSIINDLVRMAYQLYVLKPALEALKGTEFGGGGGGAGGVLGLIGGGASTASEAAPIAADAVTLTAGLSRGGIAGWDGARLEIPTSAFMQAEHFQGGGLVGTDSYPALLTPGEGVFTREQMRNLSPGGKGGDTYIFQPTIHATDAGSVRKTLPQIQSDFYRSTQRVAARNNMKDR